MAETPATARLIGLANVRDADVDASIEAERANYRLWVREQHEASMAGRRARRVT